MSNWLPNDFAEKFQLRPEDQPTPETRQTAVQAPRRRTRCPRCGGNLFFERGLPGLGTAFDLEVCLQCGEECYSDQPVVEEPEKERLPLAQL